MNLLEKMNEALEKENQKLRKRITDLEESAKLDKRLIDVLNLQIEAAETALGMFEPQFNEPLKQVG